MRLSSLVRGMSNAARLWLHPGDVPEPPKRLVDRIGHGDYRRLGRKLSRIVIEQGGLRPSDRVLDIGCGVGRLAVPLTRHLEDPGCYEGFDVDPEMVAWCQRYISPAHDRFRFRHVNVKSDRYNPAGSVSGSELVFPYAADSFSLVLATSLFTHLLSTYVENYLQQIGRVLSPGGRLLATFFLINDEARSMMAEGRTKLSFSPTAGPHHLLRHHQPEYAVAYSEDWVLRSLARHELASKVEVKHGAWCGRSDALMHQDLVIAWKA